MLICYIDYVLLIQPQRIVFYFVCNTIDNEKF